jgi:hypothetical protein
MYIVRDIFHLKFGQYRPAKQLIDEALKANLFPQNKHGRFLTDFTGTSYRLIFELGYEKLADFETERQSDMNEKEWRAWYEKFKPLVESSYREILKLVG